MKVLAFDTSSVIGLAAVVIDDRLVSHVEWRREGSHGEFLTSAIETCLTQSQISIPDLDAIAVGVGPGSFTGARIAVNAARSLAFASGKCCLTFDSCELLAASTPVQGRLAVLLDAQKNEVFVSLFEAVGSRWKQTLAPRAAQAADVQSLITSPHLVVGDGFEVLVDEAQVSPLMVRNANVSDEATAKALENLDFKMRRTFDWKDVQALYIKASGAEQKLGEGPQKKG